MKAYQIKKLSPDDFIIEIQGEEPIKFRRDIKLITAMQKYKVDAKLAMIKDLKEKGLTKEDFVSRTVVDGKTQEDWSAYEELLQSYYEVSQQEMGTQLYDKLFGMSMYQLMEKFDMRDYTDGEIFTQSVLKVLQGTNNPS